MTVQEIYDNYKIMPTLQLHQFRVAAVGQMLCDLIPDFKETKEVVTTCLLHDMGNIIKFDLNYFPEFLEPEGLEYWQRVKDEYIQKYGNEEHFATKNIVAELVDSEKIKEYVDQVGFSKLQETKEDSSLAKKICAYSDMRVGPYGIISIEERVADGRKRYEGRKDKAIGSDRFEVQANALKELERQIFEMAVGKPDDINDILVNEKIAELKSFII
jgi:5'-deoxynucleotidase YfbR-like HD superfamily hydrolase